MRPSLRRRIAAWPPKQPVRLYEDSFSTRVPCHSGAFSFNVTVWEVWARQGGARQLALAVAASQETRRAAIRQRLRCISRCYPPHASAIVEHKANEELGQPEDVEGEPGLTCTCSFEASPDEALVKELQDAEIKIVTAEAGHGATARNLEHLKAIEEHWLGFLQRLGRDPLGPAIARLAGDQQLADAITKYAAQQEQLTKDLRELCDTATEAYREKGLYEFAMTTDNAFSRLLHHITQEGQPNLNGDGGNGHRPRPAQ